MHIKIIMPSTHKVLYHESLNISFSIMKIMNALTNGVIKYIVFFRLFIITKNMHKIIYKIFGRLNLKFVLLESFL